MIVMNYYNNTIIPEYGYNKYHISPQNPKKILGGVMFWDRDQNLDKNLYYRYTYKQ